MPSHFVAFALQQCLRTSLALELHSTKRLKRFFLEGPHNMKVRMQIKSGQLYSNTHMSLKKERKEKMYAGSRKIVQCVKCLLYKYEGLSLIPGTHIKARCKSKSEHL